MSTRQKSRKVRESDSKEFPALDISSLIDVSFLLLIYFLVTSTLDPREGDLALTLPGCGGPSGPVLIDHPTVRVNELGVVFFQEEVLDADTNRRELILLLDRLKTYADANEVITGGRDSGKVFVDVADEASGQRFIDVLNCLAEAGISNIIFRDGEMGR